MDKNPITVETIVKASIDKVWAYWNEPKHITKWAFASDDWEAPSAKNDLKVGGMFKTVMAAKDLPDRQAGRSESFDFGGTYTAVKENVLVEYDMTPEPGQQARHVKIEFSEVPGGVKVTESFDPENENSEELQRSGWQSILDNFKRYTEAN